MVHTYHEPVLLQECLKWLDLRPGSVIVDGTLGGGGHTEALLAHVAGVRVIGFDADPDAIETAQRRLAAFGNRFIAVQANFKDLAPELRRLSISTIRGLLLDLGVSSHQLDEPSKGFTYRREAPLKLQLGPSARTSAYDIVNSATEADLAAIFFKLGEEKNSRRIARAIVQHRLSAPLVTTTQLAEIVRRVIPERFANKTLSRIFQALRIHVNDELDSLKNVLTAAPDLLETGGRICVISYHSLEDRIVKTFFKNEASSWVHNPALPDLNQPRAPRLTVLTKKPVLPSVEEASENPRSRSAKLRVAEKI